MKALNQVKGRRWDQQFEKKWVAQEQVSEKLLWILQKGMKLNSFSGEVTGCLENMLQALNVDCL